MSFSDQDFTERAREFNDVLGRLSLDDLNTVARFFPDVASVYLEKYESEDDAKRRLGWSIYSRLRELRADSQRLREMRNALYVLGAGR